MIRGEGKRSEVEGSDPRWSGAVRSGGKQSEVEGSRAKELRLQLARGGRGGAAWGQRPDRQPRPGRGGAAWGQRPDRQSFSPSFSASKEQACCNECAN